MRTWSCENEPYRVENTQTWNVLHSRQQKCVRFFSSLRSSKRRIEIRLKLTWISEKRGPRSRQLRLYLLGEDLWRTRYRRKWVISASSTQIMFWASTPEQPLLKYQNDLEKNYSRVRYRVINLFGGNNSQSSCTASFQRVTRRRAGTFSPRTAWLRVTRKRLTEAKYRGLGPVSGKSWNIFGPTKPVLGNLYLKTERCTCLKLLEGNHCWY